MSTRMYSQILIAVDGSDAAKRAGERGLRLAAGLDAGVTVLYVVEQEALSLTDTTDQRTQLHEAGEAALAEVEQLAEALGQSVRTTVTEDKPAITIGETAAEEGRTSSSSVDRDCRDSADGYSVARPADEGRRVGDDQADTEPK